MADENKIQMFPGVAFLHDFYHFHVLLHSLRVVRSLSGLIVRYAHLRPRICKLLIHRFATAMVLLLPVLLRLHNDSIPSLVIITALSCHLLQHCVDLRVLRQGVGVSNHSHRPFTVAISNLEYDLPQRVVLVDFGSLAFRYRSGCRGRRGSREPAGSPFLRRYRRLPLVCVGVEAHFFPAPSPCLLPGLGCHPKSVGRAN
mmetsp:Transcript_35165/g.104972  ORF Transcript_35165/g.104972 Transcript_35165/m.104972 type:complete len:200 (+) Transcript_35165:1978-2577(+)